MESTESPKNPEACELVSGRGCGYVIFGASGDLTQRKLLPSVFSLCRSKRVGEEFFIIGFARSTMDDDAFRDRVKKSIRHADNSIPEEEIASFADKCFYVSGEYDGKDGYLRLKEKAKNLATRFATDGNLVFHIATPPPLYAAIVAELGKNGLARRHQNESPFHRVIVEKPFGRDLDSADRLNTDLLEHISDDQIYRIDHYLGKETVQNILMFRFANPIFEPAWNCAHIDHVQITVAESLGVEHRAGYFEPAGLLRDMFQNHMLQLAALVGMEPPVSFDSENVRDENVKFMKSIRPFDLKNLAAQLVRGQYGPGVIAEKTTKGYRDEDGVSPTSCTETYFAMKMFVDNWRWKGVPFYLRAGKRLEKKLTQIAVVFKKAPHCMFSQANSAITPAPNVLVFDIQPKQGLSLACQAKVPGAKMCLTTMQMDFNYRDVYGSEMDEDYSTLILDCIRGDQTLFWRKDGVEASWRLLTPVLQDYETCTPAKKSNAPDMPEIYPAGGWGPAAGDRLLEKDGRQWIVA